MSRAHCTRFGRIGLQTDDPVELGDIAGGYRRMFTKGWRRADTVNDRKREATRQEAPVGAGTRSGRRTGDLSWRGIEQSLCRQRCQADQQAVAEVRRAFLARSTRLMAVRALCPRRAAQVSDVTSRQECCQAMYTSNSAGRGDYVRRWPRMLSQNP